METNKMALTNVQDYSNLNADFFDKFDNLTTEEMEATDAEYLEFTEGETHNLIFTGFEAGKFEGEEREMACFTGRNGWRYVNANAVIVNSMKKLISPCPVRIVCTGETKNAKGNKYKTFKIFTL
jgi:hypothetical protein